MPKSTYTVRGNLGAAPELSTSPQGVPWTRFSVCETDRRRDERTGEWHDVSSTWWDVVCFRALAEHAVRALGKGSPVVVEGSFQPDEWTGRDGVVHKGMRLRASWVAYDLSRHPVDVRRVQEPPVPDLRGSWGGGLPEQAPAPAVEAFESRSLTRYGSAGEADAPFDDHLDDHLDEHELDEDGVIVERTA